MSSAHLTATIEKKKKNAKKPTPTKTTQTNKNSPSSIIDRLTERKTTVLVIAAVGSSGSGKTTTLEYLIEYFSEEGYRIGTIKHIHHNNFTIDKEGTNTWRYAQAGSKIIVAISPQEIDIIKKTPNELKDLNQILLLLGNEKLDLIFIEGFHSQIAKRSDIPKIVAAKDNADLERTLNGTAPPIIAVTGIITQNNNELTYGEVPLIKISEHGYRLVKIIEEYLERQ